MGRTATDRRRGGRVIGAVAAAAALVVGAGACNDDGLDMDEEIETPAPGLDEGEDLPPYEGTEGDSDNFDPSVETDSGIQGVDEG